jgi:hypothetical protein
MKLLRIALFSLAGTLAGSIAVKAQSSCPPTTVRCSYTKEITAPSDTSYCCDFVYGRCGSARTDHATGRFHAEGSGGFDFSGGGAEIDAVDQFTILGPALPDPIAINALLDIHGYAYGSSYHFTCSSGQASFSIASAGVPAASRTINGDCTPASIDVTIGIPLAVRVGESFVLTIVTSARGAGDGGNGTADSGLRFSGLPAGYSIVSCKGYRMDSPVPTRLTSWGALKRIYR